MQWIAGKVELAGKGEPIEKAEKWTLVDCNRAAVVESIGGGEQRWWRAATVESSDRKKYYTEMDINEKEK